MIPLEFPKTAIDLPHVDTHDLGKIESKTGLLFRCKNCGVFVVMTGACSGDTGTRLFWKYADFASEKYYSPCLQDYTCDGYVMVSSLE